MKTHHHSSAHLARTLVGLALAWLVVSAPKAWGMVYKDILLYAAQSSGVVNMVYTVMRHHTDYESIKAEISFDYYVDYNAVRYVNALYYYIRTASKNPAGDMVYQELRLIRYDDGREEFHQETVSPFYFEVEYQDSYCYTSPSYWSLRNAVTGLSIGYTVLKYATSSLVKTPDLLPVFVLWAGTTLDEYCAGSGGQYYTAMQYCTAPRSSKTWLSWPRSNLIVSSFDIIPVIP